jgi:hypothetical protein
MKKKALVVDDNANNLMLEKTFWRSPALKYLKRKMLPMELPLSGKKNRIS